MLFSVTNSLKEDTLVDISNALTPPQLTLIMGLFILLIGWLVIFAYLALRPTPEKQVEQMDYPATQSTIKSPVVQIIPVEPRSSGIRTITQPTPVVPVSTNSSREIVLDHSRH